MTIIRSYGHSCFSVIADNGWTAVFDPYADGSVPGLKLPKLTADAVYTSHDHSDHNAVDLVAVRKFHFCPYTVQTLLTDHDDEDGEIRGKNRITILSSEKEKIAHFGDLGRGLSLEEGFALADADVIMIPCGGYYTIDAEMVKEILWNISPKLAILMHYRTERSGYDVLNTIREVAEVIPETDILSLSEVKLGTRTGVIALTPIQ